MAFTKIAAAGIGSTGTVTLQNVVVTGSLDASSITGAASTENVRTNSLVVSGNTGIGTTNPTTTLQVQGTTKVETSIGSTQSIWYTTLDSKSYSAKNVDLLVQPETAYSFDASQTAGRAYEPTIFSHALTSANGSYASSLYGLQNYANVAGTSPTTRIGAYGLSNGVYRNSTTDVSSFASNVLQGFFNVAQQGVNVDQSVVTGFLYGTYNTAQNYKGTATNVYTNFDITNIGNIANRSASSTNAYGYYNLMQVGAASGTGIGTLTNYYGYYGASTVAATGQLTNYYGIYLATPVVNGTLTNRYSIYSSDTSSPMYHAGSIGIGITNPTSALTVTGSGASISQLVVSGITTVAAGSTSAPSITPTGDSNTGIFFPSADTIAFAEGGVEGFRLDSNGNIGIGTAVPSQKLEVVGGEIKAGRVDTGSEGGQVSFGRATDNATGWYIDAYGNTSTPSLRFVDVSNAAVRASIDSSGNLTLNSGNLVFSTSGKGIDFSATANSSGTMTSELLADYEEGTWTPVPNGVTIVSGSPTYVGTYTKIGRMVHASIFQTAGTGTITVAAGNYFTGLPFTPANYHNTGSWSCAATGKSGVSNIFNSNSAIYIQQLISTGTSLTQFITSGVYTV